MLNYEISPAILAAHVPSGCEPDSWHGITFVSVVGFRFLRTRVLGIPIPYHTDFDEVNLRFYVRRRDGGAWRRGVVFVKEIVPRRIIAAVARGFYGENYVALPMRHQLTRGGSDSDTTVRYQWRRDGVWEGVSATFSGPPVVPSDDSEEAFITEHYWGYSRQPDGSTIEYQVEHPRWRVWCAREASADFHAAALYGPEFAGTLAGPPRTAFVADGSPVIVRRGHRLT